MKKIILSIILIFAVTLSLTAQVKVNFYLTNPRDVGSNFLIDLSATVQGGQSWKVGPTCIRVNFNTVPANQLTVIEANPVENALSNLSGNTSYSNMTTTSNGAGTAISLNIFPLYGTPNYTMAPGNYVLGTLKFLRSDPSACINMSFNTGSAIFDTLTAMAYSVYWTKTDPAPCITYISNENNEVPDNYFLSQNFPNPFNPSTSIKFGITKSSFVKLSVYDLLGRELSVLVNEQKTPGNYIVDFNASELTSGIYYYRIETENFTATKKMVLLK
jgi:hypothetical protein